MNTRLSLSFAALLCLGAGACNARRGSGHAASTSPPVTAFTRVAVRSGLRAEVTVGAAASVRLTGDDNLLPHIRVAVNDGELVIEPLPGQSFAPSQPITAVVTTPTLDAVEAAGGSSITVAGVVATAFRVELHGGAHATVSGRAEVLTVDASGGALLDANALTAREVNVSASGGVRANLRATSAVRGSGSGGVSLTVAGNPATRAVRTSGGASVTYP